MDKRDSKSRYVDPQSFNGKLIREVTRSFSRYIDLKTRGKNRSKLGNGLCKFYLERLEEITKLLNRVSIDEKSRTRLIHIRNTASTSARRMIDLARANQLEAETLGTFRQALSDIIQFWVESSVIFSNRERPSWCRIESLLQVVGHLIPRRKREALIGDLCEDIAERRAMGWKEHRLLLFMLWQLLVSGWYTLPPAFRTWLMARIIGRWI